MAGQNLDPQTAKELQAIMSAACAKFSREIRANMQALREIADLECHLVTGKPLFPDLHDPKC